jgi:porphobilinogen synthase
MIEEQRFRLGERPRRLRRTEPIRRMTAETDLLPSHLIAPLFVRHGKGVVEEVASMPGVSRYSPDTAGDQAARLAELGIRAVLLFGIPGRKDSVGTEAYSADGVVPRAIREIKESSPSTVVMADVCLCEYTDHGHCGVVVDGEVDNDRTLPLLARAAVRYASAGADVVAPSAMMDGQVRVIREALDGAGLDGTIVMGYSAKYASAFYGPFRSAAESAPSFGDRKGYQMNPANRREAMREIALDVREGADMVMVKPALAYLDVIYAARRRFDVPIVAYNVSGEYSMVKAAAANSWIDERSAVTEVLTSIRRAGADMIVTYHAEQAAGWLVEGR